MRHIALLALAAGLLTAPAALAQSFTGWMTAQQFQQDFDRRVARGQYPVDIDAGLVYGHVRYRARYMRRPPGLAFYARNGLSDSGFAKWNQHYTQRGFRLVDHQRFDTEGLVRNQAVWVRR
jgi:hypothetical protein